MIKKYWAVQVGGQGNRWPTIPSTKFKPWLLTAQAVLSVSIAVISGFLPPKSFRKYKMSLYFKSNIILSWQQPAHWLGFPVDFFFPQREFKSLTPYFNYALQKWSSCIKSDLVRLYNTVHPHNSTFFSTTLSSANIFCASKLLVYYWENRYFLVL